MVDIHHHLLFGLDDGAKSLETSVAMAKLAAADGITHIVCTPHANGQYDFSPQANAAKTEELRAILASEHIALTLGSGCDFHVSFDNIQQAKTDPARFSINGLNYLLVEVPDYGLPPGLTETFYELQLAGLTPILTHPERNPTLQSDPSRLKDWLRGGVLIQVTADSLTGHKGKPAQRMAHDLLENRWVHFLATDAHNTTSRPPRMREAHDLVANKYGASYAHALCLTNPLAAFLGKTFEVAEEPHNLFEDVAEPTWWQRVSGALNRR
ncbi:MAG TPA: CpsB/CapC family capsule biosynthesis tyrosine phosphatase [Acidobacteriaceae bacterium]|nr:CpsB/CapC family capsule biosynthesis tyrosine phosphatase [Acidobacteriaceae bacterium]